jgi:hypothetical protein
VTVARVVVDVERPEVERDVPGDVRTVDDGRDSAFARACAELLDGQPNRCLRRDVTEIERARATRDTAPDLVDGIVERR